MSASNCEKYSAVEFASEDGEYIALFFNMANGEKYLYGIKGKQYFRSAFGYYIGMEITPAKELCYIYKPGNNLDETSQEGKYGFSLTAENSAGIVKLKWGVVGGDSSRYMIYRSDEYDYSDAMPLFDFSISGTNYTDYKVEPEKTYKYYCEATDGEGNVHRSNIVEVVTPIQTEDIVVLQIDNPFFIINGESVSIDSEGTAPLLINGRTMLPIRKIIEALGGAVEWDDAERQVKIFIDDDEIILTIGDNNIAINGNNKRIDTAPVIIGARTFTPLRFVVENIGCTVDWIGEDNTVIVRKLKTF
jgi:hypothetical protein